MAAPSLTAIPPELRLIIFDMTLIHASIELGMLRANKRLRLLSGPRCLLSLAQTCSEFRREALPLFYQGHFKIRFLSDLRDETIGISSEHTVEDVHSGIVEIQDWLGGLGKNQRHIKSVSVDLGYEPQFQRIGLEPPRYEPRTTTLPMALKGLKKVFSDIGRHPDLLVTFGMNSAQCEWPLYEIQVNMQLAGPREAWQAFRKAGLRYREEHPEILAHQGRGYIQAALGPFNRLVRTLMSDEEWHWSR